MGGSAILGYQVEMASPEQQCRCVLDMQKKLERVHFDRRQTPNLGGR